MTQFTDKMTVLVPRYGDGPLKTGTTSLGVYLWEKEKTVTVTHMIGQKRDRAGIIQSWTDAEKQGVTVTSGGRLRCWVKDGKKFFTLGYEDLTALWDNTLATAGVEELCVRNGFRLVEGDTLGERILATNCPGAVAKFGLKTAKLLAKMRLSMIPQDGDMKAFFKHYQVQPENQAAFLECMKVGSATEVAHILIQQAFGLTVDPTSCPYYNYRGDVKFAYDFAWAKSLPVEFRRELSRKDPYSIKEHGDRVTVVLRHEALPSFEGPVSTWLEKVSLRSDALVIYEDIQKNANAFTQERRFWQRQGLMLDNDQGSLMWKCVKEDGTGVLGYPYQVGTPFLTNDGMATVGPWGAVKEYGSDDLYVLALRVTKSGVVMRKGKARKGVMYALEGVPVAQYRITKKTEEGFTPLLMSGSDEMALLTEIPTERDPRPYVALPGKPLVVEVEEVYSVQCLGRCNSCDSLIDMLVEGKYGDILSYNCSYCGSTRVKGVMVKMGTTVPLGDDIDDPFADR